MFRACDPSSAPAWPGVHSLVNEGTDRNLGEALVIPSFAVSQGGVAAAGGGTNGTRRGPRL